MREEKERRECTAWTQNKCETRSTMREEKERREWKTEEERGRMSGKGCR